jgi:hypothetical protein
MQSELLMALECIVVKLDSQGMQIQVLSNPCLLEKEGAGWGTFGCSRKVLTDDISDQVSMYLHFRGFCY